MQISKILTNKKALAVATGLACASVIGFSAPAQAHGGGYYGGGCSTCKVRVYKYRHFYRHYRPCCYNTCNTCCYRTCNPCNYGCGYTYRCYGCGTGYYYGGYYY